MEKLFTVKQMAVKLRMTEKGIYTRILTNKLKPKSKRGRVGYFTIDQFVKPESIVTITETFYIYESKMNTNQ
jgi:hypothetical protein